MTREKAHFDDIERASALPVTATVADAGLLARLLEELRLRRERASLWYPQPVSRWIEGDDGAAHSCERCGFTLLDPPDGIPLYMSTGYASKAVTDRLQPGWRAEMMRYCPCCGAVMGEASYAL